MIAVSRANSVSWATHIAGRLDPTRQHCDHPDNLALAHWLLFCFFSFLRGAQFFEYVELVCRNQHAHN